MRREGLSFDDPPPNPHFVPRRGELFAPRALKTLKGVRSGPMDVDASHLQRLLDLQAEDSSIRRLEDRRTSLPEAARLAGLNDSLAELDSDIAIAQKQYDEAAREQERLEGEMGILDAKIAKEEARLFAGSVSNPKELSALQAEVEMLKRQRSGLEDSLLEIMVNRDQMKETLDRLTSERSQTAAEAGTLSDQVARLSKEIDAELQTHTAARSEAAASMPSELLQLYEKLRDSKHGVGVAALVDGTCEGCHTKLPAKEVERLRAERGLQRCDNCRRILVVL
jgi:predicted  nucleic acid-binding Zn-ribbon protein